MSSFVEGSSIPESSSDTCTLNATNDEWAQWRHRFAYYVTGEKSKSESWTKLSNTLRQHDQDKVQDCKEDIDTLLVFAGLYSAILSAFIIEAYHLLKQDPADVSVELLRLISQQLISMTASHNATQTITLPAPTATPSLGSSMMLNALWICSLVFSLVTASLGILVKQWLREYLSMDCIAAKERCRVRLFRRQGLRKYHVFEIASFLPFLLQLSLVFFFLGLIQFVWPLNQLIGCIVATLVSIWVVFFFLTTMIPAFSSSCPYKTPLLRSVLQNVRGLLRPTLRPLYTLFRRYQPKEEDVVRIDPSMDETILLDADMTFRDSDVFETIRGCISDCSQTLKPDDTFRRLVEQRAGHRLVGNDLSSRDLGNLTKSELTGITQTLTQYLRTFLQRCHDLKVCQPWNGPIEDAFTLMETITHHTSSTAFGSLFEAFLLLPNAPASGALFTFRESAVKWMAERRHQLSFPGTLTVGVDLMEQIILGAETILQTQEKGLDAVLVWGVVCDFTRAMSDSEFSKLDPASLHSVASFLTTIVKHKPLSPIVPEFDLAIKLHGILDGTVIIGRKFPGVINDDLLHTLDGLCLELFRACVDAEGYHLTNWDELVQEPSCPNALYSSITFLENPLQDGAQDWRVRWLRASYSERLAVLNRVRCVPSPCVGGIVRKGSV